MKFDTSKALWVLGLIFFVFLSCESYQNIIIAGIKVIPGHNNPHRPPKENIPYQEGELVLWNKMEGKGQSVVGPAAKFYGGKFVEGKFGKAYMGELSKDDHAIFPKEVIPVKKGCIEFWAKIEGFSGVIPWGGTPIFFHTSLDSQEFILHLNGNDGEGNGGICARAGCKIHAGNGLWYNDYTYEEVFGNGKVSEWHHYALVWDEDGIDGIGLGEVWDVYDNIEEKVPRCAIYIDGELKSKRYKDEKGKFVLYKNQGLRIFDKQNDVGNAKIIIDNIKIWNYAKTDFSDRFSE